MDPDPTAHKMRIVGSGSTLVAKPYVSALFSEMVNLLFCVCHCMYFASCIFHVYILMLRVHISALRVINLYLLSRCLSIRLYECVCVYPLICACVCAGKRNKSYVPVIEIVTVNSLNS